MRVAPIVGSLAVHGAVLAALAWLALRPCSPPVGEPDARGSADPLPIEVVVDPMPAMPAPPAPTSHGGGRRGPTRAAPHRGHSAWDDVAMHVEEPDGTDGGGDGGLGAGRGGGRGNGVGFGDGGGIAEPTRVPAPPRPAPPSHERPARLLYPSRQTQVDQDELFAARITVDADGDVVGAHMLRTHPGVRGDTAASMIWQFRYDPARNTDGNPVRSTFEQTFAVR